MICCLGVTRHQSATQYLVEWLRDKPSWVTAQEFRLHSNRTVSFTVKGLGIDSLAGRTVDVWWTDSTHFDGAFADPLVVPDVLVTVCLFADALISKRNRDGTFEVKYNDGDVDRRVDLLTPAGASYTSAWGYEHLVVEWSCSIDGN